MPRRLVVAGKPHHAVDAAPDLRRERAYLCCYVLVVLP